MVQVEPTAVRQDQAPSDRVAALVAHYQSVFETSMKDMPVCHPDLRVEAVGFRRFEDALVGVLITPWFMAVVRLPDDTTPNGGVPGDEMATRQFPAGPLEMLIEDNAEVGTYEMTSLYSPMGYFSGMADALLTAREAARLLFVAPAAAKPAPLDQPKDPGRRAFFRGVLGRG